jgi:hypothetical protein
MPDHILHKLTKINMLNIIILAIVIIWSAANVKSMIAKEALHESAKETIAQLQNIMLMVLGYYLKSSTIDKVNKDHEEKAAAGPTL